jgi:hypothetical protein
MEICVIDMQLDFGITVTEHVQFRRKDSTMCSKWLLSALMQILIHMTMENTDLGRIAAQNIEVHFLCPPWVHTTYFSRIHIHGNLVD